MIRLDYLLKKDGYLFALMLITVPLAGELKFYPLNEVYRISFGAPAFFFFLSAASACAGSIVRAVDRCDRCGIPDRPGVLGRRACRLYGGFFQPISQFLFLLYICLLVLCAEGQAFFGIGR